MLTIPTGLPSLDECIGGYKGGRLYFVYGEEKSGKTSMALRASANAINLGANVLWLDCGHRLHPSRLMQVLMANGADGSRMLISPVYSFDGQEYAILSLLHGVPRRTGLIAVDDFTYLHRIAMKGELREDAPVFKRLTLQAAVLKDVAVSNDIPVLAIGQVHAVPGSGIKPVASRIVGYWSDVVIRLESLTPSMKLLRLEKDEMQLSVRFKISEFGIEEVGR